MPDYDGLPEQGDDVGDGFLWTARILTGPIYLLTEYVIRRPLAWMITEGERNHVAEWIYELVTFGPDDNIFVFPTAFYEFGFQPSVGVYAAWNEFLFRENRLSTQAGFGGPDWLSWTIADRIEVADQLEIGTRFLARKRPDFVFGGIGPYGGSIQRARFGAERMEGVFWTNLRFWQSSHLGLTVSYRAIDFIDEGWGGEPSVGERAQELGTSVPYGYSTGYEAIRSEVRADLDTRTDWGPPEGGVQLEAYAGANGAWGALPAFERWIDWGANTTLATDVLGGYRVLGVTADVRFISPIEGSNVPFTELIDVGGARGLLPGFYSGSIRGFSAAGVTAHYTWPIWAFLDARLFFGTANAFGEYLDDFSPELLRLSFGLAFFPRFNGTDAPLRLDVAWASDTFDRGADIDSFRFAIGATDVDLL